MTLLCKKYNTCWMNYVSNYAVWSAPVLALYQFLLSCRKGIHFLPNCYLPSWATSCHSNKTPNREQSHEKQEFFCFSTNSSSAEVQSALQWTFRPSAWGTALSGLPTKMIVIDFSVELFQLFAEIIMFVPSLIWYWFFLFPKYLVLLI